MRTRKTALILAAGKGQRMHSEVKKQYMMIFDKPVLYYSVKAFCDSSVDNIVIVTGAEDVDYVREEIVEKYGLSKVSDVIPGGKERYDSTYAGLMACPDSDYVLIHDAARPLVSVKVIEDAILGAMEYGAVAAGVPAKDTIRIVDDEAFSRETPDRRYLWIVQTPQAFSYAELKAAYDCMRKDRSGVKNITDDAMVLETYGGKKTRMIMAEYENIKITTPEDIELAETFLKSRCFLKK